MKEILLVCTAGITTGLLVKNMEQVIVEKALPFSVSSTSATLVKEVLEEKPVDAILVGPQAESTIRQVEDLLQAKAIPYQLISETAYSILDGASILEQAEELLE